MTLNVVNNNSWCLFFVHLRTFSCLFISYVIEKSKLFLSCKQILGFLKCTLTGALTIDAKTKKFSEISEKFSFKNVFQKYVKHLNYRKILNCVQVSGTHEHQIWNFYETRWAKAIGKYNKKFERGVLMNNWLHTYQIFL